jgi:hypothetical protein
MVAFPRWLPVHTVSPARAGRGRRQLPALLWAAAIGLPLGCATSPPAPTTAVESALARPVAATRPAASATPHWSAAVPAPVAVAVARGDTGQDVLLVASCPATSSGTCAGALHKLDLDGTVLARNWLDNLHRPAGLRARDGQVWIADGDRVVQADLGSGTVVWARSVPGANGLADVEAGYDGTVFAADPEGNRVYVLRGDQVEVLAEGGPLVHPTALHLYGGTLYVGTATAEPGQANALVAIDLATGQVERTAPHAGRVHDLDRDHLGYLVAVDATAGRLLQVTPTGDVTALPVGGADALAIDDRRAVLYLASTAAERVDALAYGPLIGEEPSRQAERAARLMQVVSQNGLHLDGAEYWPYIANREPDVPADLLWGFYPQQGEVFEGEVTRASATAAAVACAEQSYAALREVFGNPPPLLRRAIELGASTRFYLWLNDYSRASQPFPTPMRLSRFWYWQRRPAVVGRVPGFWKWETTLLQDGQCLIPNAEQITDALAAKVRELEAEATAGP